MVDLFANDKDAAGFSFHEAGVSDGACVGINAIQVNRADPGVETSQAGVGAVVGLDADLETGGEDRLARWCRDFALVAHISSHEHDAAAVASSEFGAGDFCSTLDDDITQNIRHIGGCEGGRAIGAAGDFEGAKEELGVFVVEEAIFNEVVVYRKGRGDEGAGVDLGTGAEDDAVLVDDVDLALGVDFASDLGGFGGRVEDFIEGDPLGYIHSTSRLIEIDGGLAADIESFPVEEGLGGGLFYVDIVAGGGGGVGAFPFRVCAG